MTVKLLLAVWIAAVVYGAVYLTPTVTGMGKLVRLAFFHIPVAWVSVFAFLVAAFGAFRYLQTRNIKYDWWSSSAAGLGLLFCLLATVSGAIFAKLTWGAYWNWDPRQTTIFILLLIYGAYLALRSAVEDEEQRARLGAVYALLSFVTVPFLTFIVPRYYFSLHPEPVLNSAGKLAMEPIILLILLAATGAGMLLFWQLFSWSVARKRSRYQLREAAQQLND